VIYQKNNFRADIIDPNYENFQTMMSWEKPYMEKCVEVLKPHGDVLEIGFGMGYSATAINKYPLRSYTVIEKDEGVIKRFHKWRVKQRNKKINLVKGLWQLKLPLLNKKFDCIFFDDSPSYELRNVLTNGFRNIFFIKLILMHVKYNSRAVFYGTLPEQYYGHLAKHFTYRFHKYQIKIPYYCKYAKGNYMYVNEIVFRKKDEI
tara:strand:+ start:1131 stop:1742 length:612 start_codon:yes stop_codon:yes gene_type:complete